MIELTTAITNKYKKGRALQAVSSNGMWLGLADQGTPTPYITFSIISDVPVYTSTDILGDYIVQFSFFGDDIEQVMIMFEEFEKLYNIRTLNTGDNDFVVCSRENSIGPTLIDEIWMVTADYQIMIRADRTTELIV
tara:strand:+ start:15241 stop:15648 length:408 start_codon:yes stop_codon:yes gene_type:complete